MAQSGYHHLLFYMSANTTLSLKNHVCTRDWVCTIQKALSAQVEDFWPFWPWEICARAARTCHVSVHTRDRYLHSQNNLNNNFDGICTQSCVHFWSRMCTILCALLKICLFVFEDQTEQWENHVHNTLCASKNTNWKITCTHSYGIRAVCTRATLCTRRSNWTMGGACRVSHSVQRASIKRAHTQ